MTLSLAIALSVMGHSESEEMGYIPAVDGGRILFPEIKPDSRPEHWPQEPDDYYAGRDAFVRYMSGYQGILLPLALQFRDLPLYEREAWSEFAENTNGQQ